MICLNHIVIEKKIQIGLFIKDELIDGNSKKCDAIFLVA